MSAAVSVTLGIIAVVLVLCVWLAYDQWKWEQENPGWDPSEDPWDAWDDVLDQCPKSE